MNLSFIALNKITVMFIILLIGAFCYKRGLITEHTNRSLSDISLMLVTPLLIFTSYQKPFDAQLFEGLMLSFLLSIVSFAVAIAASYLMIRKKPGSENYTIERISAIYSNCGFIGIPLIDALAGSEGVFYMAAYITIFNALLWSQGVIMMTGKSDIKSILKIVRSPSIIAVILGILCFLCRILLPDVIVEPLASIASMNTPLAMLVAGVTIAQSSLLKAVRKPRIYYVCLIRQVIAPLLVLLLLKAAPFAIPDPVMLTIVTACACPAAASGTLFAIKYQKDSLYASEIFAISTVLSMITIPAVFLLL